MAFVALAGRMTLNKAGVDLTASAFLLYLAAFLVYLQFKSLFSRGYSLRILADLDSWGGRATEDKIRLNYGGGMGLGGMIEKRLKSMAGLGLIQHEGGTYGPLRFWGRRMARSGTWYRRWIRLDRVG